MTTKIASLFDSQKEASQATEALSEHKLGDVDIRVIDASSADTTETVATSGAFVGVAGAEGRGVPALAATAPELSMSDEEQDFFVRGLRDGGVVVVVELPDEHADTATRLLRDYGGRTYEED